MNEEKIVRRFNQEKKKRKKRDGEKKKEIMCCSAADGWAVEPITSRKAMHYPSSRVVY